MKRVFLFLLVAASCQGLAFAAATSSDGAWSAVDASKFKPAAASRQWVSPEKYKVFTINQPVVVSGIMAAPPESSLAAKTGGPVLTVPKPDGMFERFSIIGVPTMEPGLAAKFPDIKTFAGVGIDDPTATIRGDWGPLGFHASVRNGTENYYVDPLYKKRIDVYAAYWLKDNASAGELECLFFGGPSPALAGLPSLSNLTALPYGTTLRTFRLALAADAEYTALVGGTVPAGQAAVVTVVSRVNHVYETEVAVRFVLVANNNLLIFTDPATDGYTDSDANALMGENQTKVDAVIGSANYDVSQVLNSTGSGVAWSLGIVCNNALKASATSSVRGAGPMDNQSIYHTCHELGHMFGAPHTWNGTQGNCVPGQWTATSAYEPGSGSTIMCYPSTCSTDNVQGGKDGYFHRDSLNNIIGFITSPSASCAAVSATGNTPPVVEAGPDIVVPVNTPFKLKAIGSDPDGDLLAYTWEQWNLGPQRPLTVPDDGVGPVFRSCLPSSNPARYFPQNAVTPAIAETLQSVANRDMLFRTTARDQRLGGGGTNEDLMTVHVVDAPATPFRVTVGNTPERWSGTTHLITWDVAGTDAVPYSMHDVKIMMSTDGGATYGYTLAEVTPNDGSEIVPLPKVTSSQVRIRVEPVASGVYDISDANVAVGAQIQVDPNPLALGLACQGDIQYGTFNVFNTGSADLNVQSIVKQPGAGSAEFDLLPTPALPVAIAPSSHVSFTVRHTPGSVAGPVQATFRVTSDDPLLPNVDVVVTARDALPAIQISPGIIRFDDVCPNALASAQQVVNICNVGECPATIPPGGIHFQPPTSDFQIVGPPVGPVVLDPGSECFPITIRFTPTAMGTRAATLVVETAEGVTASAGVIGNVADVTGSLRVTPKIAFPPTVIARIGPCGSEKALEIVNADTDCGVKVTTVTVKGLDAGAFSVVGFNDPSMFPVTLMPGEQLGDGALKVRFSPAELKTTRFLRATVEVGFVVDPTATPPIEKIIQVPVMGEAVQTGMRVVATFNNMPLLNIDAIRVRGPYLDQTWRNLPLKNVIAPSPFQNDLRFKYHAEFGGISAPNQRLMGTYQVTVYIRYANRTISRSVSFSADTCTFNPQLKINF